MTMHKALHSWDEIDWPYVSRKEEDNFNISMRWLEDYMKKIQD